MSRVIAVLQRREKRRNAECKPALDSRLTALTSHRKISATCHDPQFHHIGKRSILGFVAPRLMYASEEIATRFLFIAEHRRCKQLRGFGLMPFGKFGFILPYDIDNIREPPRVERP